MESGKFQRRFQVPLRFSVNVTELGTAGAQYSDQGINQPILSSQGTDTTTENHGVIGLEGIRKVLDQLSDA